MKCGLNQTQPSQKSTTVKSVPAVITYYLAYVVANRMMNLIIISTKPKSLRSSSHNYTKRKISN